MENFKQAKKVFIKSNNSTKKIFRRYPISLISFIILIIAYNIINQNYNYIVDFTKNIIISIFVGIILSYVVSIFKNKVKFKDIISDSILWTIIIIINLFSINNPIYIILLSIIISVLIYKLSNNLNFSSVLYGLIIIYLYNSN